MKILIIGFAIGWILLVAFMLVFVYAVGKNNKEMEERFGEKKEQNNEEV